VHATVVAILMQHQVAASIALREQRSIQRRTRARKSAVLAVADYTFVS